MLLQVAYAAGLRISEIVGLSWPDVIARDKGRAQLSIEGKGGKLRQVLLPAEVSGSLTALAPPAATGPCSACSSAPRSVLAFQRPYLRTGCVMPMVRMPWTAARRFLRSKRRWAMTISPRRPAICTLDLTAPAGCGWIPGYSGSKPDPPTRHYFLLL